MKAHTISKDRVGFQVTFKHGLKISDIVFTLNVYIL